jgi:serine/threonine-protein kinase
MVHRDIKPDNVLLLAHAPPFSPNLPPSPTLAERDFVKVVDFGVARWCGSSTRASDILGTPAYISPETLADEPVDGRSDLYAVGMLLWQMIVGELPFPSKNQAQMMKSHLDATRYRPRDINSRYRLPDALEDLMVKLIARAPSDRPSSAYEVRSQLHDLLAQPGLLPERPLRGASRPDFGPHWDGPARTTSPHQREVDQSAITVKMPTRIDAT